MAETILAFDFGEKRIGTAVGNDILREAQPLETLSARTNNARFAAIGILIAEWQPQRLVVGVPFSEHEAETVAHSIRQRCERFANQLHGRFNLPVERVDERYSSLDADTARRSLRRAGVSKRTSANDHLAAQIILQRYLDQTRIGDAPIDPQAGADAG